MLRVKIKYLLMFFFFENFQHLWSIFAANVEFMTFVLILIEVWIWERDYVSFYANGHKDPKNNKNTKQNMDNQ